MKIKWNDTNTEATISKEDLESLQNASKSATEQFNAGFEKGKAKGNKDILKHFDFLELDEEDIAGSVKGMRKLMTDLKEGRFPDELLKKIKDTDIVKDLQSKLENALSEKNNLKQEYDVFKRQSLIDSQIKNLASRPDATEAFNSDQVSKLFLSDFKIEIDDKNNIVVQSLNGAPVFGQDGKELGMEAVFNTWAEKNPHLFKGNKTGGSGGGPGTLPAGVSYKDLKTDDQKAEYVGKYGLEAFQKLVQNSK